MHAYVDNKTRTIIEPEKKLEILAEVDVLVCGGGPAGFGAAVAAAKNGVKVAVVEQSGCMGGLGTNGLVTSFMAMTGFTGGRQVIKGVFEDLISKLEAEGAAIRGNEINRRLPEWGKLRCEPDTGVTPFSVEAYKRIADQMLLDLGVEIFYHTTAASVVMDDKRVCGVIVESKSGRQAILAKQVVDCTGDADIAAWAGADFEVGRPEDGVTMPLTTMFVIGGVDDTTRTHEWDPETYYGAVNMFPLMRKGEYRVEMCRTGGNGLNVRDLTDAEITCRKQIPVIMDYLNHKHKGTENAYLIKSADTVGVQDTRRILGEYVMTEDDILNYRIPEDVVCMNGYGVDLHNPDGSGALLNWLIPGHAYGIPYRSLIPLKIDNVLVGGRSISSNVSAQSSLRCMATCMATGEAAGTAAAMSAKLGIVPRELPITELQAQLRSQNVYLGEDEPPVPERRSYLVQPGMTEYEWNK